MSTPCSTKAAAGFRLFWLAASAALVGGCVAPPPAPAPIAELAGTAWRVATVNGRPTPTQGDYSIRFDASGGIGARFGCNSMGGRYRIVGGTLTVSNLAQTLMGCPEPAATFENEGARIMARPMQVSFTSDERMGLGNAAGSIGLVPIVPVTAAELQGSWNVTSINGVATPRGPNFRVTFRGDRIEGRFGCNHYQSIYSIEDGRFRPVHGSYTEMACEDGVPSAPSISVMQLEQWAFAVLRSGPEAKRGPDGALSLVGGGGSIELRRAP